ncbi:MAG: Crp/Fnr family transcriptional regulator [Erythrobacter sp.]|uniref:Crp/Fnr family transcriptional regulator n=1 Tax=Erythrobacter sp. TaxID=1042 RepID=UPI0025D0BAE1|nr:Crp/Fnr family transcriptional regulator [Erythrobacter sp.]MCL9997905.1 Crp/Fnr family transcriptional regulator [Erythrobacter sp.]
MPNAFLSRLQSRAHLQESDTKIIEDLCHKTRKIPSKQYLSRGGQGALSFSVLLSGWAARFQVVRNGGRQITQLLLPGDAFDYDPHSSDEAVDEIVTLHDCAVVNINYTEIYRAIEGSPAIRSAMLNYGCMENAIFASWVVNIGRRDAYERMAHLICELQHRLTIDDAGEVENEFLFPLTQEDLADVLGLTPVHINRKLQMLRENDMIRLRSKRMTILNLPGLKKIAGFNPSYLTSRNSVQDRWAVHA